MYNFRASKTKTELQVARTTAMQELENHTPGSESYKDIMTQIGTLTELINSEKSEKLSPNTLAVILGNLGVASLVLWYERDNVMTTKLFPFLSKPKD